MPFTIQLDLDDHTEAIMAALADRLARVPGLETVRQIGDVHHLSLGVYEDLPTDLVVPKLVRFAETIKPLDIRLANVGIFPGAVIFLGPVATGELLELHRRVHEVFADFSGSCWPHYRPGVWVPHVTVAMNIKSVSTAVEEIMRVWKPGPAKFDALRLIEFRPVRTLVCCKLSSVN
jgi:2'-5' RNA ligase